MKKIIYILFLSFLVISNSYSQIQIGNGSLEAHPGSALDLRGEGGLIMPRASLSDVSVFGLSSNSSKTEGMMIYNTNADIKNGDGIGVYLWSGSRWMKLGKIPVNNITISGLDEVSVGSTITLNASVFPDNATDATVSWSIVSGNNLISIDADGKITGISPGTAVVRATANDGSGVTKTFEITIVCPIPNTPGEITFNPSNLTINQNGVFTASIEAVPGAVSYKWTLPSGLIVSSESGSNSITIIGSSPGTYSSNSISVKAINSCGNESASRFGNGTDDITVHDCTSAPSSPSAIAFNATSIYQNSTFTASVTATTGVKYEWTVPSGLTITSGNGTASVVIKGTNIATYNRSDITVKAVNSCGSSEIVKGTGTIAVVVATGDCKTLRIGSNNYYTCLYNGVRWMVQNSKEGTPSARMYNNNSSQVNGYYYDWNQALTACPSGWHLPTNTEATNLVNYVSANKNADVSQWWISTSGNAFAGYAISTSSTMWWDWGKIGTWYISTTAWYAFVAGTSGTISRPANNPGWNSVRCVQDY